MSILARVLVLVLLIPGCDIPKPTPKAAPRVEEAKTDASGDRTGLSTCLAACAEEGLSATDAATCRNNCGMAFKVAPTAAEPAFDSAAECIGRCGDSACVSGCKEAALKADGALASEQLDRLETCVGGCKADKALAETDRWTCVRNCAQTSKTPDAPAAAPQ